MPGGDLSATNIRSARDALLLWYGFLQTTRAIESDYSPAATAVQIGKWTNTRLGFIISNSGTANVAIGFSAGVTLANGILLLQGAAFVSNWLTDGEAVFAPMWAISTAGGGTIHMVENVLQGA
jgi:hypothetical protein